MIKLLDILNEEFLKSIIAPGLYDIGMYKNPKTITRMEPYIRGISDPKGNLFVVDDSHNLIHRDMYNLLIDDNLIKNYGKDFYLIMHGGLLIAWQRVKSTNTFKLSESYYSYDIGELSQDKDFMNDVDKVRKKNSQYKFELKKITDS